jgi:hypothetical protein
MRLRILLPSALLLASAAGCDRVLQTEPTTALPQSQMIVDPATAQAALNGAYDALQSGSYYGLSALLLGDLPADNAIWTGTFQYLGDVQTNRILADNAEVTALWTAIYTQIARDNVILELVPGLPATAPGVAGIADSTRNRILGEAHFLRALSYHNLVKFWGDVPMPLTAAKGPAEAEAYTRTPASQVYTQILSDLERADALIPATQTNTRYATRTAARALRARVLLYRAGLAGNANSAADYQAALDAAQSVLQGRDTLVVAYADLFAAAGTATSEDIFRVNFNTTETNSLSNYYLRVGRGEVAPSTDISNAYPAGDLRRAWSITASGVASRPLDGSKYRARPGTEHVHVIRLAELVLIKAEVLARQNNLSAAVAQYNKVRVRAGLRAHVLGTDVTTQAQVLDAIDRERRLELAFEGDRWPDLVRTGRVATVKQLPNPGYTLFPIPLRDIRTTPGLTQNPGY